MNGWILAAIMACSFFTFVVAAILIAIRVTKNCEDPYIRMARRARDLTAEARAKGLFDYTKPPQPPTTTQ
jgi:hypothetical protein